jgi:hypothetical protein
MDKTYLSLEEAQKLIPLIKNDVLRMMSLNKTISLLNSVKIEFEDRYETMIHEIKFNKKLHGLSYQFYEIMESLHSKGCVIKDLGRGLIYFNSFFHGREIFLCWNATEDKIKHWHETSVGYNSKKPVSMLIKGIRN